MIQHVSSMQPLDKVGYFQRGDGLADIRIRRNITSTDHAATDTEPAWTEYEADEAYTVRDLTLQEAVEQADQIYTDVEQSSKPAEDRMRDIEQSSLDNAEAIAEIFTMLAGGDAQ